MSLTGLNSQAHVTALVSSLLFGPTTASQQPKVLVPHKPVAPKLTPARFATTS